MIKPTITANIYLLKHKKAAHNVTYVKTGQCYYSCPTCPFKSTKKDFLFKHYEEIHGLNIEQTTAIFQSFEDFKSWKEDIEKKTQSKFIKDSGTHKRGNQIFHF